MRSRWADQAALEVWERYEPERAALAREALRRDPFETVLRRWLVDLIRQIPDDDLEAFPLDWAREELARALRAFRAGGTAGPEG